MCEGRFPPALAITRNNNHKVTTARLSVYEMTIQILILVGRTHNVKKYIYIYKIDISERTEKGKRKSYELKNGEISDKCIHQIVRS